MIVLSDHAIDRYIERLRPALDRAHARAELASLTTRGRRVTAPPAWCPWVRGDLFLMLGDDVALPLAQHRGRTVAVTVLTRDTITPRERARRRTDRRARRQARQHRNANSDPRRRLRLVPAPEPEDLVA